MLVLFIILFALSIKAQTKMDLGLEFEGQIWYSYVIDSTYLGVNLPNGELPRREDGTYLYWAYPLTPVIKYRKKPDSDLIKYSVMQ